jgi:threonine synthase
VAVGETFIAAVRGFREMAASGLIRRAPTMVAAQATRANAVSRAFQSGQPLVPVRVQYTVAEGLAAGSPGRKGEWVLRLVREDKGLVADVDDPAILDAQRRLVRTEGVWAGPTGVASLAVFIQLLADKRIDPGQRFCVVLTETGLKTEADVQRPTGTAFDYASLRRLVHDRLGGG